ncbi:MAG: hypothetical protein ACP5N7_03905 [Candidatus Pacearchaeota archaeon]
MINGNNVFTRLFIFGMVRLPIWISVPWLWWHFVMDVVAVLFLIFIDKIFE